MRRADLEEIDSNIKILDLVGTNNTRIINIYRSFALQHNVAQREKFIKMRNSLNDSSSSSSSSSSNGFHSNWKLLPGHRLDYLSKLKPFNKTYHRNIAIDISVCVQIKQETEKSTR